MGHLTSSEAVPFCKMYLYVKYSLLVRAVSSLIDSLVFSEKLSVHQAMKALSQSLYDYFVNEVLHGAN